MRQRVNRRRHGIDTARVPSESGQAVDHFFESKEQSGRKFLLLELSTWAATLAGCQELGAAGPCQSRLVVVPCLPDFHFAIIDLHKNGSGNAPVDPCALCDIVKMESSTERALLPLGFGEAAGVAP